jgi:hypothetical protein
MRVPDANLEQYEAEGFTIVPGFLDPDMLAQAREGIWDVFPRPEDYFADPAAYPRLGESQFSGIELFPYPSWGLNQVPCCADLADAARRALHSDDIQLYKIELWAKYAGAVDYDQVHHRDYGNHTLVAPSDDIRYRQLTTILLLSDVTEADGPTRIVPLSRTRHLPMEPRLLERGAFAAEEIPVVGPAGSLLMYRTDVFHRGSGFGGPGRHRFAMLMDFMRRGTPWIGKHAWAHQTGRKGWNEAISRMTPAQRDLFGWPRPGDPYWTAQTLADVQLRYPHMDLSPYRP